MYTYNTPPPFQAAQNATTVNTRSSVAPCTAQRHTLASPECHPGWCVSVSQPPAEVCLTDLAWDYPGV